MNIFILDHDIAQCARYHCDQHVGKMILESTQILCTALHNRGMDAPYRPTHSRHPSVLWAGASMDNFRWLVRLAHELNAEYRYRYRKPADHASVRVLKLVQDTEFESNGLTEFPQAMPDSYKVAGNAVEAYRNFYLGEKAAFATWTRRPQPDWWLPHAA